MKTTKDDDFDSTIVMFGSEWVMQVHPSRNLPILLLVAALRQVTIAPLNAKVVTVVRFVTFVSILQQPRSDSLPARQTKPLGCVRVLFTIAALAFLLFSSSAPLIPQRNFRFFKNYCIKCHGSEKQKGDRRFDALKGDLTLLEEAEAREILDQLTRLKCHQR